MKRFKYSLALIFIISLLLHCSKQYKEAAPFLDGLFLEYETDVKTFAGREKIKTVYNVHSLGNDRFKITKTENQTFFGDGVKEYFVDSYGKVYESSCRECEGKFSPIWIPAHTMEIGDTFDERKIIKRNKWNQWNVVVVKSQISAIGAEWYYDANTGFLVGVYTSDAIGGKVTRKLINTNANILVVQ
jgi:hypothetical protein